MLEPMGPAPMAPAAMPAQDQYGQQTQDPYSQQPEMQGGAGIIEPVSDPGLVEPTSEQTLLEPHSDGPAFGGQSEADTGVRGGRVGHGAQEDVAPQPPAWIELHARGRDAALFDAVAFLPPRGLGVHAQTDDVPARSDALSGGVQAGHREDQRSSGPGMSVG